jgi:lysophospholipase L1-like esterase
MREEHGADSEGPSSSASLDSPPAASEPTRLGLSRNLLLREVLTPLGALAVLLAVVVLSPPVAFALMFNDEVPHPNLSRHLEWLRLLLGTGGLALMAVARTRTGALRTPVKRGEVVLLLMAGLFAFAVAEVWLRFRGAREWGSALRTPLPMRNMRGEGNAALQPGRYGQLVTSDFDPSYERFATFSINRLGLRGRAAEARKAPGTKRVICLGGSTTFGYSVSDGEDWPALLQQRLGPGFEVLNAGRPGSTTFRNFPYLRDRLLRLEPDVVVLYEGFNDMWRGVRSHFAEQADYGMVVESLPGAEQSLDLGPPREWPLRPSFLAHQAGAWLERRLDSDSPNPGDRESAGPFRLDPTIVAIYSHNLRAMVSLCRRNGVRVLVLTFAGCDKPEAAEAEQRRRLRYVLDAMPALDPSSAQEALARYREETQRVARAEDVPFFDLASEMSKQLDAFTDTVHFSPRGESEVAQRVFDALRAETLVETAP